MTKQQISTFAQLASNPAVAQLLAGLLQSNAAPKARKERTYAKGHHVDDVASKRLDRITLIGKGFGRRGIKVTFDKATGRFENVKPYKSWLADGMQVRKGEKSVRGFFHVSQCDPMTKPAPIDTTELYIGKVVAA